MAKKYDMPEVYAVFTKHTIELLDQKLLASAVEINIQTKNYLQAAKIILRVCYHNYILQINIFPIFKSYGVLSMILLF